jgi:hypothetical protein
MNRLEKLSRDVLLYIIGKIDDSCSLFCCSRYFNDFGKKHKLRAHEKALIELSKIAPYAIVVGCPQFNLSMIRRGQETMYTAVLEYENSQDEYVRNRTYSLKGIKLGCLEDQIFDGVRPIFSLKGAPARKGSKIPLFCVAKDTSTVRSNGSSFDTFESSYFEFRYATKETLEETSLWKDFCSESVNIFHRNIETKLSEKHWDERHVIILEIQSYRAERNRMRDELFQTMTPEQQDQWYRDFNFVKDAREEDILQRLREIDECHRAIQEQTKETIYSMQDTIIKEAKDTLIKTGRYYDYMFGLCDLIEK